MQRGVTAEQTATGRGEAGVLRRGGLTAAPAACRRSSLSFLCFKATLRQSIPAVQMRCHLARTVYGLLLLLANDFFFFLFFTLALVSEFTHFSLKTTGGWNRVAIFCTERSHTLGRLKLRFKISDFRY